MSETVDIPVADLLLDPGNARLGSEQTSQQAVCTALAKQQGRRIVKLAEDIVNNGLDPTALIAVVPTSDRRKRYKVIEGNRRVLALKALDTPALVASALSASEQRRLSELSSRYQDRPIDPVPCVLFESDSEASHWVVIRHTGINEGIGLVEWDANEQDRYKARHGGSGRRTAAGQVIDFVDKIEGSHGSSNRILTNVKRLISTPAVRELLGIDTVQGQVVSHFPAEEVAKGLRRIVHDFRDGRAKVTDIYYEDNRLAYVNKLPPADLPDPKKRLKDPVVLEGLATGKSRTVGTASAKKRKYRIQAPRTALIPNSCSLSIDPPRINAIYVELLMLNVEQYPNACAVMLRVFLELSIDHKITEEELLTERERRNTPLSKRLKLVASHLKTAGQINGQLETAIVGIADGHSVVAASSTTFNQYVHNQYVYPKQSDLRVSWDELQPFVEALWA